MLKLEYVQLSLILKWFLRKCGICTDAGWAAYGDGQPELLEIRALALDSVSASLPLCNYPPHLSFSVIRTAVIFHICWLPNREDNSL